LLLENACELVMTVTHFTTGCGVGGKISDFPKFTTLIFQKCPTPTP